MPHPVVEDYRKDCLDICEMRRQGLLSKPCEIQGSIRWPKVATMIIDRAGIDIEHRNGQRQSFKLSWAKCFANSVRPWLVCGHCSKRFAKLYRGFGGYACRECLGTWYTCQIVSTRKRQIRRLHKIAAQIDGRPWQYVEGKYVTFPKRPKGVHRRRYYRLQGRAADLEAELGFVSNMALRQTRGINRQRAGYLALTR